MTSRKRFHEGFDAATLLKLEIFRGYVRYWLHVFLSKATYPSIHIYDFFAGPGADDQGNPGSPLLIMEELGLCLSAKNITRASGTEITLHFNDKDCASIERLRCHCDDRETLASGYSVAFTCLAFATAFKEALPSLKHGTTANLVLIDQFGMKEVNEQVFRALMDCPTTDVLFFISSWNIGRFISEESVKKHVPFIDESIRKVGPKSIHRSVCEQYRKLVPHDREYYLAPFSIEKEDNPNIHGIVFCTSSLLGLQKFLTVSWEKDEVTGEANYNIDGDFVRDGQLALLPECEVVKKRDVFARDLEAFMAKEMPDNRQLYRFILENGFLPKHSTGILRSLQQQGRLSVYDVENNEKARRGAYYLSYDHYSSGIPRVKFNLKDDSHGRQPH